MADTRSISDVDATVSDLASQLADFKTTAMARMQTRPTGDIEETLRTTPKTGTLFLNGQTVSRATYPALWQWAQDQSLVRANLFTTGDGSTTFGLPDFRGRVTRGVAASGETTGTLTGADTHTLTTNEMPSHTHTTNNGGQHGGHMSGTAPVPAGSDGIQDAWYGGDAQSPFHTHTVNNTGGGAAFDTRQAGIAINWLIWV